MSKKKEIIYEPKAENDWDICRLSCANDFVKDLEETLTKNKN